MSRSNILAFSVSKASLLTQTGGTLTGRSKSASGMRRGSALAEEEKELVIPLTENALLSQSKIEDSPTLNADFGYL